TPASTSPDNIARLLAVGTPFYPSTARREAFGTVASDVAGLDRRPQAGQRIPGRDELLADVAGVTDVHQLLDDGGVVDLLRLVQFAAARVAGGVDVADDVLVLLD